MGDLRHLFSRYLPRVRALAARLVGDSDDAEDIAQDTFVEVWRRAAEFDANRGPEAAWLATIARSRALDLLRRRVARARKLSELQPPAEEPPRRDQGRLALALGQLTAAQRKLVELAYVEGLTHAEIAIRTGAPLGTVKTRIRRCLHLLSTQLEGESGNDEAPVSPSVVAAAARQRR